MTNRRQRELLARLDRRRLHLDTRIAYDDGDTGREYDRAERAALVWALGLLYAANELSLLERLEEHAAAVRQEREREAR